MDRDKLKIWMEFLADLKIAAIKATHEKQPLTPAFSVNLINAIEQIVKILTEEPKR